ncbi:MAG TPA: LPS export ABC transporter ATP-binding protein [Gemmatimonadaceae bacterium]|nr:LPS export ABC transporter ATP-binding protein [Gemmatimonadaceae bacterium]
MTGSAPSTLHTLLDHLAHGDRSTVLALTALVSTADERGVTTLQRAAEQYRAEHLADLKVHGRDVHSVAGELGLDQVRKYLAVTVLPRLAGEGVIVADGLDPENPDGLIRIVGSYWDSMAPARAELVEQFRHTGEMPVVPGASTPAAATVSVPAGSELKAEGLVKIYRRRKVVNNVALRLQQGEIVGLLGPNGAGKTTTFYMIVGLIQPLSGQIRLDGKNITSMPMYRRARQGLGYLSQEPSVFRKLTVEENLLAILETLPLSKAERHERLETLLDELNIKHLRKSKAFALSGGERRRLEITRALVTQPKFMMLDEPFAGVDPIAVHDIQTIVAGLRTRGIGVLISDHNVEQTLDIVDRAYIMYDGEVRVSGTVRELVFDDTVADIYLGPTLTARLRARFAEADEGGVNA